MLGIKEILYMYLPTTVRLLPTSLQRTHNCVYVYWRVCCFADPDGHDQACALCRFLLWTGLLFPSSVNRRTFPSLHLDPKACAHTRADQSDIGNDCACAEDAPSLNRHNRNQKVAALKPVSALSEAVLIRAENALQGHGTAGVTEANRERHRRRHGSRV